MQAAGRQAGKQMHCAEARESTVGLLTLRRQVSITLLFLLLCKLTFHYWLACLLFELSFYHLLNKLLSNDLSINHQN